MTRSEAQNREVSSQWEVREGLPQGLLEGLPWGAVLTVQLPKLGDHRAGHAGVIGGREGKEAAVFAQGGLGALWPQ